MNEKDDTFLTFTEERKMGGKIQFTEHTSFVLVGYDIVSFLFFFSFSNHNYMYIKNFHFTSLNKII